MDTLDKFMESLSEEEKENFERHSQFYTLSDKNQVKNYIIIF